MYSIIQSLPPSVSEALPNLVPDDAAPFLFCTASSARPKIETGPVMPCDDASAEPQAAAGLRWPGGHLLQRKYDWSAVLGLG